MEIYTKLYYGNTLKEGINLALKHRLYISGWSLSGTLVGMRNHPKPEHRVALTFKDKTPVAVAVYYPTPEYRENHQAFCRKSERKKGYASLALKKIRTSVGNNELRYCSGLKGSERFWEKFDGYQIF